VRQAVTSYRQPSLAAELVSSRRMLASAGIDCRVRAPGAYSLPSLVDALLAWTVREGATNIVRHAAAKHAEIVIEVTDAEASACLSDDGMGPSANGAAPGETATAGPDAGTGVDPGPAPAAGSGLAGLAERAARLGGTMSAGTGQNGGFRLQVSVPLTAPPELTAPAGEPAGAEAIEPADKRVPS
jgi:two-component system sensor histidine kinase DesK